jgi:putative two-component system hydrogenase maturation factor HypX/HoxX
VSYFLGFASLRILLLVSAFNSLTQRVYCFLRESGHVVSVQFSIDDTSMENAVRDFNPEIIFSPYLIKKVPKSIWSKIPVIVIHPGPLGDRGASSLDWAVFRDEPTWGVTTLQANDEMDAGDIWVTSNFKMRKTSKAFLYRKEVSEIALLHVNSVIENFQQDNFKPTPQTNLNEIHNSLSQKERNIDWNKDKVMDIIRKINSSDSHPGVKDEILGVECYLFGVHSEAVLRGKPKEILAKRDGAICLGCIDGAVWISHLKEPNRFKLPATYVLKDRLRGVKEVRIPLFVKPDLETFKEITFEQNGRVGYLGFDFYNGAMSAEQCIRLKYAIETLSEEVEILVLKGGENFFSNGIHLTILEDSKKQGEDGWSNINAMNNLVKTILFCDKVTVASFGANAGAGGVFLGLACDFVVARESIVLNPHYKTMGLSGSEYHSYSFPKRVGAVRANKILDEALPIGTKRAKEIGMIDIVLNNEGYKEKLEEFCEGLLSDEDEYYDFLDEKSDRLEQDEKLIHDCKENELKKMHPEFWDETSEFHKLRADFVYKVCPIKTPERLICTSFQ